MRLTEQHRTIPGKHKIALNVYWSVIITELTNNIAFHHLKYRTIGLD